MFQKEISHAALLLKLEWLSFGKSDLPRLEYPLIFLRSFLYGIEKSAAGASREGQLSIEAAARAFDVSADLLNEYEHEGLLISFKPTQGVSYYGVRDAKWVHLIGRLRRHAHLSFKSIREMLVIDCDCWKIRHCKFDSRAACPLTNDLSEPCWVNRAKCSVLCSYPSYFCRVYRSATRCQRLVAISGSF